MVENMAYLELNTEYGKMVSYVNMNFNVYILFSFL
jgi:hypothetical protein